MRFLLSQPQEGIRALGLCLLQALEAKQRVLWFVSGGSNIPISVQTMATIPPPLSQQLTIMLADERYGPVGHVDSNTQQLHDAGFVPKQATFLAVPNDDDFKNTVSTYQSLVAQQLAVSDLVVAQLGIGADGHIAGILPWSKAAADTSDLFIGYDTPGFNRMTLSFTALRQVQIAFAFVYGTGKRQALLQLRDKTLPLEIQPAQILKTIPKANIYNDQVAEEVAT